VFAVLATLFAAGAHTLAGGGPPSPFFCLVIAAIALPAATALARPEPSLWRTALAVGGAQALFHVVFALTGDLAGSSTGHHHGSVALAPLAAAETVAPHGAMFVAHAAAAALTVLAVYRGERVIRSIAAWIPRFLRRIIAARAVIPRPRMLSARGLAPRTPSRLTRPGPVTRRGPPTSAPLPA
jgi:hypothetical protein